MRSPVPALKVGSRLAVYVIAAGITFVASDAAASAAPPPAVAQYVESLPNGTGGTSAVGVGTKRVRNLPSNVTRGLGRLKSPSARILRDLSTKSSYGAQPDQAKVRAGHRRGSSVGPPLNIPSISAIGAAGSTLSGSGTRTILLLVAILFAITAGVVVTAPRRR
jgi:hypothetical protein